MHLPLHVVDDIKRFGSPENISSGPGESQHKESVKAPGGKTQFRSNTFEAQTARNYVDNLAVRRAFLDHQKWEESIDDNAKTEPGEWLSSGDESINQAAGIPFLEVYPNFIKYKRKSIVGDIPNWKSSAVTCHDVITICRMVLTQTKLPKIEVYGKLTRNDKVYLGHPC